MPNSIYVWFVPIDWLIYISLFHLFPFVMYSWTFAWNSVLFLLYNSAASMLSGSSKFNRSWKRNFKHVINQLGTTHRSVYILKVTVVKNTISLNSFDRGTNKRSLQILPRTLVTLGWIGKILITTLRCTSVLTRICKRGSSNATRHGGRVNATHNVRNAESTPCIATARAWRILE